MRRYLHRYAKAAEFENDQQITPHTLRRSCATEMIRADHCSSRSSVLVAGEQHAGATPRD